MEQRFNGKSMEEIYDEVDQWLREAGKVYREHEKDIIVDYRPEKLTEMESAFRIIIQLAKFNEGTVTQEIGEVWPGTGGISILCEKFVLDNDLSRAMFTSAVELCDVCALLPRTDGRISIDFAFNALGDVRLKGEEQ